MLTSVEKRKTHIHRLTNFADYESMKWPTSPNHQQRQLIEQYVTERLVI